MCPSTPRTAAPATVRFRSPYASTGLCQNARMRKNTLSIVAILAALTLTAGAQSRDRSQTPDKFKWNLAELYPTDAAWRAAKTKLAGDLPQLRQFQGKLASSAATLADALERQAAFSKELNREYTYAGMLADQDTRDSSHEAMRQEMNQINAAFGAESAYYEPELLKAGQERIRALVASEPRL